LFSFVEKFHSEAVKTVEELVIGSACTCEKVEELKYI